MPKPMLYFSYRSDAWQGMAYATVHTVPLTDVGKNKANKLKYVMFLLSCSIFMEFVHLIE